MDSTNTDGAPLYGTFPAADPGRSFGFEPRLYPARNNWHSVQTQAPGPYFGPGEMRFFRSRVLDDSPPHFRERQIMPCGTVRSAVKAWHPSNGPIAVPLPGCASDGWTYGPGAVRTVRDAWNRSGYAVGTRTDTSGPCTFSAHIGPMQRFLWHEGGTREAEHAIGRIRVDADNPTALVCERWQPADTEWPRAALGTWVHVCSVSYTPAQGWYVCG
jgi:hypothetical protein